MGLGNAAKELRQKAESNELRMLRDMRAFVREHDKTYMNAYWYKIKAFEESRESLTEDGQKTLLVMIANAKRWDRLRSVYSITLQNAERAERIRKGGGEQLIRDKREEIDRKLAEIEAKYKEECRYQTVLDV